MAPAEYHFAVSVARSSLAALAIVGAAYAAVAPAGVANADVCSGYGPGLVIGPADCGPPNNSGTGGGDTSSQPADSSWPPGTDYGSGDDDAGAPATPIVPASSPPSAEPPR